MLQGLIFDVDGTIADTEELHRLAFNEAFAVHGLDWQWSPELYARLLETAGGKERIAAYLEQRGMPGLHRDQRADLIRAIHASKTAAYRRLIQDGEVRARPGVQRLMREALAAGLRLAIASTTTLENIEPLLKASLGAEAGGWFSVVATGDVAARKKPAPDIYQEALARLRLDPASAIAFEDSAIGVTAAKAAGLFTVASPTRWTQGQDLRDADLLLDSLGDPSSPLEAPDQRRIGAAWLGLEQLARLLASRQTEDRSCPLT